MKIQRSFKPTITDNEQLKEIGSLYLVATPIGNLEDMTMRAIRILQEVDIIAAEDTRQTRKLLTHFEIKTRLVSYHEHNKQSSGPELIKMLLDGQSIAVVSDAGMPAISDPGQEIVKEAIEHEIPVIPIPGANAALSALIMSGLSTDRFVFIGFLPREKRQLEQELAKYTQYIETLIFYESPHRIKKTLQSMLNVLGNRKISIIRELTKRHEEALRGTIEQSLIYFEEHQPLGEYCIIIEGLDAQAKLQLEEEASQWWQQLSLEEHVKHYESSLSRKEAIKKAAQDRGIPKREVYNEVNR